MCQVYVYILHIHKFIQLPPNFIKDEGRKRLNNLSNIE